MPEFGVCLRHNFSIAASMHMPEASVDEDNFAMPGQNNVGFSGEIFAVQSKPKAHLMEINSTSDTMAHQQFMKF